MKLQILKIWFYLCCSIAMGTGISTYYVSDGCDDVSICSEANPEFEDNICFDILVHQMCLYLEENDYSFDITLTERPAEWPTADIEPSSCGTAINLPLRAPPFVG